MPGPRRRFSVEPGHADRQVRRRRVGEDAPEVSSFSSAIWHEKGTRSWRERKMPELAYVLLP